MSQFNDCISDKCLSADNVIKNNDVDISVSKTIPPMEEIGNEALPISVKDTMQSEISKTKSENKTSEDQHLQKDMIPIELDTTTVIKDSSEEIPILPVKQDNDATPMVTKNDKVLISKLENEVKETINERDMYKQKLAETEKKLADLESTITNVIDNAGNNEANVHAVLTELRNKLTDTTMQLEDRGVIMANQEKQINALNHQVVTLKEVVAITRDLLQIRNTEVKHLQAEVDDMEARITEEREKHNAMVSKMDAAVRLNYDLKKEYETQLGLFKDLRIKYDEKITLLSEEKRALESANQPIISQAEKE